MKISRYVLAATCALSISCGKRAGPAPEAIDISVPYEIDSLDPHARNTVSNFAIARHFYEPLVRTDAQLRVEPCLAASWETPDPFTWLFHIRPEVQFHSGKALRAADVVYSFMRLLQSQTLEMRTRLSNVTEVLAVGPLDVRVRVSRPIGAFLNKLNFVLIIPDGSQTKDLERVEDGTGPYRLNQWNPGASIVMTRDEQYWGPRPALRTARFLLGRSPEDALEDFLSGRSAFAQSNSKKLRAAAARRENSVVMQQNSLFLKYLSFDFQHAVTPECSERTNPFLKPEVRQAIQMALDRANLVSILSTSAIPANQIVPNFVFGHDPSVRDPKYDPDAAREMLARAGFPHGFQVTLHTRQMLGQTAEWVRGELGKIGIRVKIQTLPDHEFFLAMERHEVSFFLSRFGCATGDAADALDDSIHSPDEALHFGGGNSCGYRNTEVDRLIEESAGAARAELRQKQLQRTIRLLADDLPWIPLYFDQDLYALDARFDWRPRGDSYVFAQEIELAVR